MARNLTDAQDGSLRGKRYLIHDRDPLFTKEFREALSGAGLKIHQVAPEFAEPKCECGALFRTIKESCLGNNIGRGGAI